jgi:hypothetical protein
MIKFKATFDWLRYITKHLSNIIESIEILQRIRLNNRQYMRSSCGASVINLIPI